MTHDTMLRFLRALALSTRLRFYGKRVVAFDLPSMGELQFIGPVMDAYARRNPGARMLLVHNNTTKADVELELAHLKGRLWHVPRSILDRWLFPRIGVFLTSEQYDRGIEGIYSIAMFHGHAAKGLSFVPEIISTFDALFLIGPIHRQAFDDFVREFCGDARPAQLDLHEVGYPKSDALLAGCYEADKVRADLQLTEGKKTILYAPAFNEGASLREHGVALIELLASQAEYNVVVKLPIDCSRPTSDFYATGGVDWFSKIRELNSRFPNLRLFSDYKIDPLLSVADVLVTCVSSVGFEFMALNKPVIFVDTPNFFSGFLQRRFPTRDTASWASRTTVNGGREFGLVVASISEIPSAIRTVLDNPKEFPRQQERLQRYLLYNRGRGSEVAAKKLEQLLDSGTHSSRTTTRQEVGAWARGRLHERLFSEPYWKLRNRVSRLAREYVIGLLNARGYTLQKTGSGYIDAKATVEAAKKAGVSICGYLEGRETDLRKRGRRDRIIAAMSARKLLVDKRVVVELGAGTGMYLDEVVRLAQPEVYHVYEPDVGWVNYLKTKASSFPSTKVAFHAADGETMKEVPSGSCDLVHAHGVFVYIPILKTLSYIRDSARVLRVGGHLVFDCYPECKMDVPTANNWLRGKWRFPVVVPLTVIDSFAASCGLRCIGQFDEVHGDGETRYLVYERDSV